MWSSGTGGFGSTNDVCSWNNSSNVSTAWPLNTDILIRTHFTASARLYLSGTVDNDATVYLNGLQIASASGGNCRDGVIEAVIPAALLQADNVLAVRGHDEGTADFLSVQLSTSPPTPSIAEQGYGSPDNETQLSCSAADPVNCSTGWLYEDYTDALVQGRQTIAVNRSYSSGRAATDGVFGYGWTSLMESQVEVDPMSGTVSVIDSGGSQVSFAQSGTGYVAVAPRVLASLQKNTDGSWDLHRRPSLQIWHYSSAGQLVSITDRNDYLTTFTRNPSGLVTRIADTTDRGVDVSWTGHRIASITDPLDRVTTYTYDGSGNLTSVQDPLGRTTTYNYDANHRIVGITNPRGGTVTTGYDGAGRVAQQQSAAGRVTTFAYTGDPFTTAGSTTTITRPTGQTTTVTFQNMARIRTSTSVGTTTFDYDQTGLPAQISDPLGRTTTNTYDSRGNLLTSTDPTGATTTYTYDTNDQVVSVRQPSGATTTTTYDARSNPVTRTDPAGKTTTLTYADTAYPGDLTQVEDPAGRRLTYTYDSAGNPTTRTSSPTSGTTHITSMSYNADGQRICTSTPSQTDQGISCPSTGTPPTGATVIGYNATGQVVSVTDPTGATTSYVYDGNDNLTSTTDPDGRMATTGYDADDRVVTSTTGAGTPVAATTSYGYDLMPGTGQCTAGLLPGVAWCQTAIDPNGHVSTTGYDTGGRILGTVRPNGALTRLVSDAAGQVTSGTAPDGTVTSLSYDADGRVTSRSYSDGTPSVTYGYDVDGRRTSMVDGTGTTTYAYDTAGRPVTVTSPGGRVISYGYDAGGGVTSMTYPSGRVVATPLDGEGEPVSLADGSGHTTTFAYSPDGILTGQSLGNGVQVATSLDGAGRPTATTVSRTTTAAGTQTLASFADTYTAAGLVASHTDAGAVTATGAPSTTTYSYDANARLTGASMGGTSTAYGYDAAGNPTTIRAAAQAFSTADEVLSATTSGSVTGYGYDQAGNRVSTQPASGATTSLVVDGAGNLTAVIAATPVTGQGPPTGTTAAVVGSDGAIRVRTGTGNWTTLPGTTLTVATSTPPAVLTDTTGRTHLVAVTGAGALAWRTTSAATAWTTLPASTGAGCTNVAATLDTTTGGPPGTITIACRSGSTVKTWTLPAGTDTPTPAGPTTLTGLTVSQSVAAATTTTTPLVAGAGTGVTLLAVGPTYTTTSGAQANLYTRTTTSGWVKADSLLTGLCTSGPAVLARSGIAVAACQTSTGIRVGWHAGTRHGAYTLTGTTTLVGAPALTATGNAVVLTGTTTTGVPTGVTLPFTPTAPPASSWVTWTGTTTPTGTVAAGPAVASPLQQAATYTGDGIRATTTTSTGTTTTYTYDTSTTIPRLLTDGTRDYLYNPDGTPLQHNTGTTTATYYTHDRTGTTRLLTNQAGATTATYTTDPYGTTTRSTGTTGTPLIYGGGYTDQATGLIYLVHRYYDPTTAQFISVDPLQTLTGSLYRYVTSNPLTQSDPLGLWSWDDTAVVLGGISAAAGVAALFPTPLSPLLEGVSLAAGLGATVIDCRNGISATCLVDAAATLIPAVGAGFRAATSATKTAETALNGVLQAYPGSILPAVRGVSPEMGDAVDAVMGVYGLGFGAGGFGSGLNEILKECV